MIVMRTGPITKNYVTMGKLVLVSGKWRAQPTLAQESNLKVYALNFNFRCLCPTNKYLLKAYDLHQTSSFKQN